MKKVYQIFIMLHKKHNANKSLHSIGWKSRTFTADERKWKTFLLQSELIGIRVVITRVTTRIVT